MKRGEEGHIQRTRRDVPEIVRADEQGLREVIVKSRVGIWEWGCVWRRDGRVETVFQRVDRDGEPEGGGGEVEGKREEESEE